MTYLKRRLLRAKLRAFCEKMDDFFADTSFDEEPLGGMPCLKHRSPLEFEGQTEPAAADVF